VFGPPPLLVYHPKYRGGNTAGIYARWPYLCRWGALLAGSELPRTPSMRSSSHALRYGPTLRRFTRFFIAPSSPRGLLSACSTCAPKIPTFWYATASAARPASSDDCWRKRRYLWRSCCLVVGRVHPRRPHARFGGAFLRGVASPRVRGGCPIGGAGLGEDPPEAGCSEEGPPHPSGSRRPGAGLDERAHRAEK
jgi:hypothetical protein